MLKIKVGERVHKKHVNRRVRYAFQSLTVTYSPMDLENPDKVDQKDCDKGFDNLYPIH